MLHLVIVEDDERERKEIAAFAQRFLDETGRNGRVFLFADGRELLERYPDSADILLMDVEMEGMDGIAAARQIRSFDSHVMIFFITHLAQYALDGYSVQAFDYLVKPVAYGDFREHLERAVSKWEKRHRPVIRVQVRKQVMFLDAQEIRYVETSLKKVLIHTGNESIHATETMMSMEEKLPRDAFFRIHQAFLINMRYVSRVDEQSVWLGGISLPVSKHRKKEFLQAFTSYMRDPYD